MTPAIASAHGSLAPHGSGSGRVLAGAPAEPRSATSGSTDTSRRTSSRGGAANGSMVVESRSGVLESRSKSSAATLATPLTSSAQNPTVVARRGNLMSRAMSGRFYHDPELTVKRGPD